MFFLTISPVHYFTSSLFHQFAFKRYGSSNNLADNFTYSYYSGTNKLQRVTGSRDQYTYDNNGNLTLDDINKNIDIKYDHRNLMIENKNVLSLFTYKTFYRYDEDCQSQFSETAKPFLRPVIE